MFGKSMVLKVTYGMLGEHPGILLQTSSDLAVAACCQAAGGGGGGLTLQQFCTLKTVCFP